MTLSVDDRRENLRHALIAFLNELGDRPLNLFIIDRAKYPQVVSTTWTELSERYWIEEAASNIEWYTFTPFGYVQALKVSGRADEPQLHKELGKLCKVLKDSVKDRASSSFVDLWHVVKESGVSETFVRNALDADLISEILGRVGAQWDGGNMIEVPPNFGLTPL